MARRRSRGAAIFAIDYERARHAAREAAALPGPRRAGSCGSTPRVAAAMPGVRAVVTAADAPRRVRACSSRTSRSSPSASCATSGEPVAAVAADTLDAARAALAAIELEIDPLPAVTDIDAAIADGAPLVHEEWETYASATEGCSRRQLACGKPSSTSGDVAAAFARDDVVVSRTCSACRASTRLHRAALRGRQLRDRPLPRPHLDSVPGLVRDRPPRPRRPPSAVRVVADTVGGGFGGKLDAGLEPYAALLSRVGRGRPVKLVNTRRRSSSRGTMRENAIVQLRSAVTRDGDIVGQEAEWLMDAGAYAARRQRSPGRGATVARGVPRGRASATAAMPSTRTRRRPARSVASCGAIHVFALERHIDQIATRARPRPARLAPAQRVSAGGSDAERPGTRTTTAFAEAFERIEKVAPWAEVSARRPYHGVGIAAVTWLTNPLAGSATLKLNEDGTVGVDQRRDRHRLGRGDDRSSRRSSRKNSASTRRTCCCTRPTRMPRPTTPAPRAAGRSTTSAMRSCAPPATCVARSSSARWA